MQVAFRVLSFLNAVEPSVHAALAVLAAVPTPHSPPCVHASAGWRGMGIGERPASEPEGRKLGLRTVAR